MRNVDFEEVYNRYSQNVFRFCLSLCGNHAIAADMTSETFLKAIKSSGSFRGDCSIKVWLCQIAKNTYYDHLRKHSKFTELSDDMPMTSDFELELLNKAEALKIHKLLHRFPEPYKKSFLCEYFLNCHFQRLARFFRNQKVGQE